MDSLKASGLFSSGFVHVDTDELVGRYNECLESMGIEPTSLQEFCIDGIGWSPEIAEEKQDPNYLCHGVANPMAIVLTPDQHNKPVCVSQYSFERDLMQAYFRAYARELADITADSAVWLDMEEGISHYRSPYELLLLGDVQVRTTAIGILQAACNDQQTLVSRFNEPGEGWFDTALRQAILASARKHGDLRERHVFIPEMTFSATKVFHARAFGGVFVLRGLAVNNFMIFEDANLVPDEERGHTLVYPVAGLRWLMLLLQDGILKINLQFYAANPEELRRIQECILATTVCHHHEELNFSELTSGQKKSFIKKYGDEIPELYFELDVLLRQLETGVIPALEDLSPSLQAAIAHPPQSTPQPVRTVLWQLLTTATPVDTWRVYRYNKSLFYTMFAG